MSNYTIVMTKILETCKGFQGFFRLMLVPGGGIEVTFRNPYDCLCSLMSLRKLFLIPVYVLSFLNDSGIEHIGGDMSLNIPKADDIFMKVSKLVLL
ncbi:hypothetical protein YC2023_009507 [Brassica napus]